MIRKGREKDLLVFLKALRDETLTMRKVSMDEARLTAVSRRAFDENDKRVCSRLFECYRDWAREAAVRESRTGISTGAAMEAAHRILIPRWI